MVATYIHQDITKNAEIMKRTVGATISFDIGYREIILLKTKVHLYYVNGLVDDMTVTEMLKTLIEINDLESDKDQLSDIINNRLVNQQVETKTKFQEAIEQLLAGLVVIFIDGKRHVLVVDVRQYPGRQPEEPDTERVIRGARDGFTENVIECTALIRRRIRDPNLRNEMVQAGVRTKTDICISYLKDVANDEFIKVVKEKIKKINIDNLVMTDKALTELLFNKKWNPFPVVRYTERPDVAAHHILSGYVILFVDTSPNAIILPTTFFDHLEHAEEYRVTPLAGTFLRWIRFTAVFISIYLLPLWLLFVLEPSLLPKELSYIGPKEEGNVPIALQIILADLGVEFLRMAAIHTPTPLATALGLIAAVLIGDIAIEVGLFSSEVILYVALSTVGFYVTPSYELSVANKILKLFLLLLTIFWGVNGFFIGVTLSLIYLIHSHTLQTPYLWPLVPFYFPSFYKMMLRISITQDKRRPPIVFPKDEIRQR